MIRVVVADDHGVVREGIRHILESDPDFDVVAEASNGAEAIRAVTEHRPDIAVLDVSMPGQTGLEVAGVLREQAPETRLLFLSMYDNPEYVLEAVRSGASGYLLKDSAATDLLQAVRAVHGGEAFFSPAVARRLSDAVRGEMDQAHRRTALASLTGRERDVLVGVAKGLTNKEIAAELGISHRTVETHRESLMRKLNIRTVAGLTKLALEEGLVAG